MENRHTCELVRLKVCISIDSERIQLQITRRLRERSNMYMDSYSRDSTISGNAC